MAQDNITKFYQAFNEKYDNFASEQEFRDFLADADDDKFKNLYNAFNDAYDNFSDVAAMRVYLGYPGGATQQSVPVADAAGAGAPAVRKTDKPYASGQQDQQYTPSAGVSYPKAGGAKPVSKPTQQPKQQTAQQRSDAPRYGSLPMGMQTLNPAQQNAPANYVERGATPSKEYQEHAATNEALASKRMDRAAEASWKKAEAQTAAAKNDAAKKRNEYAVSMNGGAMNGSSLFGEMLFDNKKAEFTYHDLQKMADDSWDMLSEDDKNAMINDIYNEVKASNPDADDNAAMDYARAMARQRSDQRMFEYAVKMNAPKSATDYFFRKAIGMNAISVITDAMARKASGTTGDMEARMVAEQRYEDDGHKISGVLGTVAGFAFDPTLLIAGGVGSASVKGAMWAAGKKFGEAAVRKGATTLGGRIATGAIAGSANLGTFESIGSALDQLKWGGAMSVDENGRVVVGDYSVKDIVKQGIHGYLMGAATGTIAPLIGNVGNRAVAATGSTAGKAAIRTGELAASTVAEGTIFAVPDMIKAAKEDESVMDVWSDSMMMIAGFKVHGMLKSAPRRIMELAGSKNTKAGFETRLRGILEGEPGLDLTADERAELKEGGYEDLDRLVEGYKNSERDLRIAGEAPSRRLIGTGEESELPYNRFVQLMQDNNISEAARAKMYYYISGKQLPMSTIMSSKITENRDEDGKVTGYVVESFGANGVITRRTFDSEERANVEVDKIDRQIELNGTDIGERYTDAMADNRRKFEACQKVGEEYGVAAEPLYRLMQQDPESLSDVERMWAEKINDVYEGLGNKYSSLEIRIDIDAEYGVDVDKAIAKEPGRRSAIEIETLEEYKKRLYEGVEKEESDVRDAADPTDPPATGTDREDPSFRRGADASDEEARDIYTEAKMAPGDADVEASVRGVEKRVNDAVDMAVAEHAEQIKAYTHEDGNVHAVTMRETDEDGNPLKRYLIKGNVVMFEDGSGVDRAKSDNSVIVLNIETGKKEMVAPDAIYGVDYVRPASEELEAYRAYYESVGKQHLSDLMGEVVVNEGQMLTMEDGTEAAVLSVEGDVVKVQRIDGQMVSVSLSDMQRIADEAAVADYMQRHAGEVKEAAEEAVEPAADAAGAVAGVDEQGNPIYADGRLAIEKVGSLEEITDADFESPTRNIELPELPKNVQDAIGTNGKPVVIKKNIFEKNLATHDDLDAEDGRNILQAALYNPTLVGVTQPITRPDYKVAVRTGDKNSVVVLDVYQGKDNVEVVGWRIVNEKGVEKMKRQAEREGGQFLILSPNDGSAAALSALPSGLSSDGKDTEISGTDQKNNEKSAEEVEYENAVNAFGEKASRKIKATFDDRAADLEKKQKSLDKAQSDFDDAPIGKDEKAKKALDKAQEEYDKSKADYDHWAAVKAMDDKVAMAAAAERLKAMTEERARQEAIDAKKHAEAVEEEQQRQAEELAKRAEQEERGAYAVHPAIREKWEGSKKVEGMENEIVLPNGERISGRYMMVESGAVTPSHDARNGFAKSEGFPVDDNGNTVNDRDYERDADAQRVTRDMASKYDGRALQSVPVVSKDGVVLSGNGRTMAGDIAAAEGTDAGYIETLMKYPQQFGFTSEQVEGMEHPRVVFVAKEDMPYTAETFAKFNQQDMKAQSRTEQSVKLGKLVDDDAFGRIVRRINGFDTLSDFYNDEKAGAEALQELYKAGAINDMQLAEMRDGDKLSAVGRQMLENMLIGKAFDGNPDAIRMLSEYAAMRQRVITALGEIVNNKKLGEEYSLEKELAESISLAYQARKSGVKDGEAVSGYALQTNIFTFDDGETVADYENATMLMLADLLNGRETNKLKNTMALYNDAAKDAAAGQIDMFSGDVRSKEEILKDVLNTLNYGNRKDIESRLNEAAEQRKQGAAGEEEAGGVQQDDAAQDGVGEGREAAEVGGAITGVVEDDGRGVKAVKALEDAYRSGDKAEIQKAVDEIKKLYEQGVNIKLEDEDAVDADALEDYDGDDPKMLAEQYAVRLARHMYADDDADLGYIESGIKTDGTQQQKAEGGVKEVSAEQRMMTEALVNLLNGGGMDASADVEEGQRILDEANGRVQMLADSNRRKEREKELDVKAEAISIVTGKSKKEVRRELADAERERREKAKEVYDIILSGEYNDVSLQKIQDFIDDATPNSEYGRRVSERLPQRVERKMLEGKRGDEVEALISRVSESSIPANERAREATRGGIAEAKKILLEKWAKAAGKWHTELSDFTNESEPIGHGNDSDVYPAKDGEHVVKLSRGKNDKRFKSDPDAVTLFNYVFPNSAYRVLGYGDFGKGFVRILEQPIVDFSNATPLTVEERVEYMDKLGFKPINKECTAFSNGELLVADLQKSNIVRSNDGNIRVIDADVKLHTKDVGGNYTYLPVEHDLPQGEGLQMHKADESSPVYYSNAYRAVEGIKQEKATPEQWLAMLQKNGGLKAGEDKWIGLSEWLKDAQRRTAENGGKNTLTKQEVLDYIAQNKIEIEDVEYGERELYFDYDYEDGLYHLEGHPEWTYKNVGGYKYIAYLNGKFSFEAYSESVVRSLIQDKIGADKTINDTRLSYTTKGLENKREVALVVPNIDPYNESDEIHFGDAGNGRAVAWARFGDAKSYNTTFEERDAEYENYVASLVDKYGEKAMANPRECCTREEVREMNRLWDEIQHPTQGAQKVLVIDEIQSKRHQDGRENGYEPKVKPEDIVLEYSDDGSNYVKATWNGREEGIRRTFESDDAARKYFANVFSSGNGVPDAPFDKNWHELAMKRMLRYAAENGYDKVAWTTGAQQAERYNLAKVLDGAELLSSNDKQRIYDVTDKSGGRFRMKVDNEGRIIESDLNGVNKGMLLSDVMGKDIADKMSELDVNDDNEGMMSFDDLSIGGEGMKGFYDQMLPKFMDKYGKKWGVKTGEVTLDLPNESDRVMHSVDVTPEMKESVMEGQPMFFKTESGEVYGFVKDGKIYVDPRIATSETPIHEYTHLWTAALRKANPKAWEQLKKLMAKEKELMDYVEKKYPELKGNDDAMMDEVFAHYSGKRGKERLDAEMKAEMEKADGVLAKAKIAEIFGKIKAALDMFWNMARDLFAGSVKGLNKMKAEDFADMAMNDLLNGFNPKNNNGIPAAEQKTMMGAHNISEEKLRKALKKGGLANPSVAVVDTRKGGHNDYGEITLLPTSALMLEKQRGRNAGTWMADAWTPTYPHVSVLPGKDTEKVYKQIREEWSASEPNEEIKNKLMSNLRYYIDANDRGHNEHLQYQFLKEQGMQPEVFEKKNEYDKEFYAFLQNLSEETGLPINELVFSEHGDKVGEYYGKKAADKVLEKVGDVTDEQREKITKDFVEKWKDNKGSLDHKVYDIYRLAQRPASETDVDKTFSEAEFTVNTSSELRKEYDQWLSALDERLGMEEKLFAGYTPSGNRRYVANTLENASKLMNKGGRAGNFGWGGDGPFIAKIAEQANTLDKMRKNKDKLIGKDQEFLHKEARQHIKDELFDLSQVLNEGYGRFDSVGDARMEEIAGMKGDIRGYLKREYGVEVSDEWMQRYNDLVNYIRNEYPVYYFETKFNRPVELWEFSNAIVPKDASEDVVEGLKRAGVNVTFYDKEVKGDRERVVNEVADNTGVKFHKADDADLAKPEVRDAVEELKEGKSVKAYRAMQMVDGKLYPPMAAVVEGKYVEPTEPGDLHISDERPDLAKNGKFKLDKGNGSYVWAAYNPYFHTSLSPLNDQFASAWSRDNLVTVEVEIPESELSSGYRAEGAKNTVGMTEWKSGPVSSELAKAGNPRKVMLSRYCKVNRVLDDAEVAERIADMLAESGVDGIPFNTVSPSLREELVKAGVKITEPQKGNAGDAARGAYEEWKRTADAGAAGATDRQGNPIDNDGKLIVEKVDSISDLTDEDFTKPTRSVQLPELPKVVDDAIGVNGKPVVIKKNIFEKNLRDHSDVTPENSRDILTSALYNTNLYGQNKKKSKPYNWVVINIKDTEKNKLVLLEVSDEKDNVEIIHWHYIDNRGLEKIKRQAEREDGQLLILPSLTEEVGALSDPTHGLSSSGKITNNFETDKKNVSERGNDDVRFRGDDGREYPSYETRVAHAKRSGYTQEQYDALPQRDWDNMVARANELVDKLGVKDNVSFIESNEGLTGKKKTAKGWFDPKSGRVVIVLQNNSSVEDIEQTIFHEVVAHYGLRKLFGDKFDIFLDNVFENADNYVRSNIENLMSEGKSQREATEEYIASLAEDGNFDRHEGFWGKVKMAFLEMLRSLGRVGARLREKISDNELRYLLWRSYENMVNPGRYKDIVDIAKDVTMRDKCGVHQYTYADGLEYIAAEEGRGEYDPNGGGKRNGKAEREVKNLSREDVAVLNHEAMRINAELIAEGKTIPDTLGIFTSNHFVIVKNEDLGNISPIRAFDIEKDKNGAIDAVRRTLEEYNRLGVGEFGDSLIADAGNIFGADLWDSGSREFGRRQNDDGSVLSMGNGESSDRGADAELDSGADLGDDGVLFREGEEDNIWKDESVGLDEKRTASFAMFADRHAEDKVVLNDAIQAIGGNISQLKKAAIAQRTYDRATTNRVADLARVLIQYGWINPDSKGEMKRIISIVKNSVGKNDLSGEVNKLMNIMIKDQIDAAEGRLDELMKIKGGKVNAKGIEVMGKLDPEGQAIMKYFKDAIGKTSGKVMMDDKDIEERMSKLEDIIANSKDDAKKENAALEYTALKFAKDYKDAIIGSLREESDIRREIKEAEMATDADREYIEELNEALVKNKIDRLNAYNELVGKLAGAMQQSMDNAAEWKEREQMRIEDIHHNANSDLEGKDDSEHGKDGFGDKVTNLGAATIFSPLGTFEQFFRLFGSKSAKGEGYLFNRYVRGWVDARNKEIIGYRGKVKVLDEKVKELFGRYSTMKDLIEGLRKMPSMQVSFKDGSTIKDHKLNQGQLMYIYMVNKMNDGRMKLRHMGITKEDVEEITGMLDPRIVRLADWIQDEFLVDSRNEYNETHKRLFGASMASIDDYFPLKINQRSRTKTSEEIDNEGRKVDGVSVGTGSIIKRRVNNTALDLTNANALEVLIEHVQDMEHWNAFAEFNRDLNILRTYKKFENRVKNMRTAYGAGDELWKRFNDLCQIAVGDYSKHHETPNLDKAVLNIAKGVTAAKVSFRLFTALKQITSAPAFWSEARADHLLASVAMPRKAWNWCMENLPMFKERWQSRMIGDPIMAKTEMDAGTWRNGFADKASRIGMAPNAAVDAFTIAVGSYAVYKSRLAKYKKLGYDEDRAEKMAKQDAAIAFNLSQQSSEGAFVSRVQSDRTVASTMFTIFRNSSMSYTRMAFNSTRNIARSMDVMSYNDRVEFMKKQYERDGIDAEKAERNAKNDTWLEFGRNIVRAGIFAYLLPFVWNYVKVSPYMIFGDDDDEKEKMMDEVYAQTMYGPVEGLLGGDVMSEAGKMVKMGQVNVEYLKKELPITSDFYNVFKKFQNGYNMEAINDIINFVVQAGIGVNPQTLEDAVCAIIDVCEGDEKLANEAVIFAMKVINAPQRQIEKLYFDEIGMSGKEASKLTPQELVERYAKYKTRRDTFITFQWDDEKSMGKNKKRGMKDMKERMYRFTDPDGEEAYVDFEKAIKQWHKDYEAAKKDNKKEAFETEIDERDGEGSTATYKMLWNDKKNRISRVEDMEKRYIEASTPEEAAEIAEVIKNYKKMVFNIIDARGAEPTQNLLQVSLDKIYEDYKTKYGK